MKLNNIKKKALAAYNTLKNNYTKCNFIKHNYTKNKWIFISDIVLWGLLILSILLSMTMVVYSLLLIFIAMLLAFQKEFYKVEMEELYEEYVYLKEELEMLKCVVEKGEK